MMLSACPRPAPPAPPMPGPAESQRVEWKQSWRDEYLKWVCAFANTDGGVLEVGRDDDGRPVGVENARKLLEDLPNKMRDVLGLVADVDLLEKGGKDVVRIAVEPYPYPVSYKGEYHVRSGSTKQVLKGPALDRFLLGKTGKRWDDVPVPDVSVAELSGKSIDGFRTRAAASGRVRQADLDLTDEELLGKLRLLDGDYLKRAAVLLFHPDPEAYFNGAWVKIGYFRGENDLLFHDEVHGDLFTQVDRTLDLLTTKYLKAAVSYEGVQRRERLPVPEAALRETVLNAVAHRDYGSGVPTQIKVFGDRVRFWNNGRLPDGWTVDRLTQTHPSQPFNPAVARVFFRAGLIEAWGRGISEIMEACAGHRIAPPELVYEEIGLTVAYRFRAIETGGLGADLVPKPGPSRDQALVLAAGREAKSLVDLMGVVDRSNRSKFRDQVLRPLLAGGLMEMSLPGKPTSPNQRYRTTAAGLRALDESGGDP